MFNLKNKNETGRTNSTYTHTHTLGNSFRRRVFGVLDIRCNFKRMAKRLLTHNSSEATNLIQP